MNADVTILVPAAGASSRMQGRDKLMEQVGGDTALQHAVRIAAGSGARVIVTLPDGGPHCAARRAALTGLRCQPLPIRDYQDGMSASIRAGVQVAGMSSGLMIHLPDMPDIEPADIQRLLDAFARDPQFPVRAGTADGRPGHPVILPRRLFATLAVLAGDRGAAEAIASMPIQIVKLADDRAVTDLDTPQDWQAWRERR